MEILLVEISQFDVVFVYMVFQDILKVVVGEVVDNEYIFVVVLYFFFFIGQFLFFDFYVIFFGQVVECFGIGYLFVFYDEVYCVVVFVVIEIFVKFFGGRYVE